MKNNKLYVFEYFDGILCLQRYAVGYAIKEYPGNRTIWANFKTKRSALNFLSYVKTHNNKYLKAITKLINNNVGVEYPIARQFNRR